MSSTSKGWLGSKRRVICSYCGKESRYDNLSRHTISVHGQKTPVKYSVIEPKDNVISLFKAKEKVPTDNLDISDNYDDENKEKGSDGAGAEGDSDLINLLHVDTNQNETEAGGSGAVVMLERDVESDNDDMENNTAKESFCQSELKRKVSETKDYNANEEKKIRLDFDAFEKKLDSFKDNLFNKIDEKFSNLDKQTQKDNETTIMGSLDDQKEEQLVEKMMATTDLEGFEKSLEDIDIAKVDETDEEIIFFCKVCFENTPPPVTEKNVTGSFTLDLRAFVAQKTVKPQHQPRSFRSLKFNMKNHILKTQHHRQKAEEKRRMLKTKQDRVSRNQLVGLNLFRIRYSDLKQHLPRTAFEDNVLTAKLNGTDVGNINNSRFFAKDIDINLFEVMKDDLKEALETKLEATKEKRPIGLLFDKMTPAKETGQIHAIIIPVPENPLSQPLLVPVCLEVPPVTEHSVPALAKLAMSVLKKFGVEDSQLEGIAVDGEYVKKGIKAKLLEELDIPNMDEEDKAAWITCVWDPAHELELAMKDVRKDVVFDWLENHIKMINEATEILSIGKGLQQSLRAAEDLGQRLYKLRNMSSTRFVAYFFDCLDNNERSLSISIEVLKEKSESATTKKDLKEKVGRILKTWKTQQWMMINLGLIDIFRVVSMASKSLQKVEIFPWDVLSIQEELLTKLRDMASIKVAMVDSEEFENNLDENLWPSLSQDIKNILRGEYRGQDTTVFQMFRRGRSGDDIQSSSLSILKTVENRLSSLCKSLASKLESRLAKEKDHQSSAIIAMMGKCFDINTILEKGMTDVEFNEAGMKALEEIVGKAGYSLEETKAVMDQYKIFKQRLYKLHHSDQDNSELIRINKHLLYKCHECTEDCMAKTKKSCSSTGKLILPKQPIPMKFLQLFLMREELYRNIEMFLHLTLRCVLKTHAETVAESMGNLVDMHCEKRRGLGIADVGKETFIDWNGPPVHLADNLGTKVINRIFKGSNWHFITGANQLDSEVTRRLKQKKSKLPFF